MVHPMDFDSNAVELDNNAYMITYLIKADYVKLIVYLYFTIEIWNISFDKFIACFHNFFSHRYIHNNSRISYCLKMYELNRNLSNSDSNHFIDNTVF